MPALLLPILLLVLNGDPPQNSGRLAGIVVNGSRKGEPLANIEVQLRAGIGGVLEPVETTKTDIYGNFAFSDLPLDAGIVFLPGANRDGVHYPGQRVQLGRSNHSAQVKIVAFDAVQEPSPLTASRHDIDIELEDRVLKVTETLVVSNPSRTTYIGKPQGERGSVTLRLTIPENFDRVTFTHEFFGRRFQIIDHRLVTELPWPPGDKELQFAYRIPLEGHAAGEFRRPLDLPSSSVRLRVKGDGIEHVTSNFFPLAGAADEAIFTSRENPLPVGYTVELEIGKLPVPWMRYARWSTLFVMAVLMLATLWLRRRRQPSPTLYSDQLTPQRGLSHPTRCAHRRAA